MTESQMQERHGDLAAAADELLDAWAEEGPNEDAHVAALEAVTEAHPAFAVHLGRLAAHRKDDDTSEVTAESAAGRDVVRLCGDQTDEVVATLQRQKANRLLGALVGLGISARLNGLTRWEPPADVDATLSE